MTGNGIHFPYEFKGAGGRTGKIKKWSGGKFGIYFRHGGKKHTNSFTSFEAAYTYLERVFEQLDKGISPNHVLSSTAGDDLRAYQELLQILREAVPGATLREALDYFITNRNANPFKPKPLNTKGSLVRLFIFAQDMLHAIPKGQEVAPQRVDNPKEGKKAPVEIYTPAEMKKLLQTARASFPEMLPVIVIQGFLGLPRRR